MPLDSTTYLASDHSQTIAILDRTADLIGDPKRWCKRKMKQERWFGLAPSAYCLMGALEVASNRKLTDICYSNSDALTVAWLSLIHAIPSYYKEPYGVIGFNDVETTTHADILQLIARAKELLQGA